MSNEVSFLFGVIFLMLFFIPIGILEFYIYYYIQDKRNKVTKLQVSLLLLWGVISIYFIYSYAVSLDIIYFINILVSSMLFIVVLFITYKITGLKEKHHKGG